MGSIIDILFGHLPLVIGIIWVLLVMNKKRARNQKKQEMAKRQAEAGTAEAGAESSAAGEVPRPDISSAQKKNKERILKTLSAQMGIVLEDEEPEGEEYSPEQSEDSPWAARQTARQSAPQAARQTAGQAAPQAARPVWEPVQAVQERTVPLRASAAQSSVSEASASGPAALQFEPAKQSVSAPAGELSEPLSPPGSEVSKSPKTFENISRLSPVAQGMAWSVILGKPAGMDS